METPAHVLRFWESKFTQVKPVKRAGGRRYYRPDDMLLLGGIKQLLHHDGITIKAAQSFLRSKGIKHVMNLSCDPEPTRAGEPESSEKAAPVASLQTEEITPALPASDAGEAKKAAPQAKTAEPKVPKTIHPDPKPATPAPAAPNVSAPVFAVPKFAAQPKPANAYSAGELKQIEELYYRLKIIRNTMRRRANAN